MNQHNDERMNIKEMTALCFMVAGIPYNQVRVIAHDVIPVGYYWRESLVHPAGASQVSVMPAPVESLFGSVVEYIGDTTGEFVQGNFYECHNKTPFIEFIDFWNMTEPLPRKRHRIRKLEGRWTNIL